MRKSIYIILIFLLSSCISKSSLKSVFPYIDFNANSAKVWIINSSSDKNDKNTPALHAYKTSFTFFKNNTFIKQELIHLGSQEGETGKYRVVQDYDEFHLHLHYTNKDKEAYKLKYLDSETLILENNQTKVIWEFKTLTPPL